MPIVRRREMQLVASSGLRFSSDLTETINKCQICQVTRSLTVSMCGLYTGSAVVAGEVVSGQPTSMAEYHY